MKANHNAGLLAAISFLIFFFMFQVSSASAQSDADTIRPKRVYVFEIKEEISSPAWHLVRHSLKAARDTAADIILIHMNTYGGELGTADSIRTAILQSKIPVWVFIDNNAASAGALISIAADSIYMRPGANIGAATVVNQTGEALPDKYQSYMRSMMRSTAEASGRDPLIAEGMVDPRIMVPGISDSGAVITFTASEAMKYGFCEGTANSIPEVLTTAGITDYQIIRYELSVSDRIIRFLVNPLISGLLIMVIIGGIYFELQTPGVGFPIAASILAALLYFAPLYVEGLAAHWEIIIFAVGVVLIAVEIFVLPGFGVAGISGIVLVVAGLVLSMLGNTGFDFSLLHIDDITVALFTVIIATFLALVGSIYLSKKLFTSNVFGGLALSSTQEKSDGFTSAQSSYTSMINREGVARTVLRPAGKVLIDDEIFDATAESGFIDKIRRCALHATSMRSFSFAKFPDYQSENTLLQ